MSGVLKAASEFYVVLSLAGLGRGDGIECREAVPGCGLWHDSPCAKGPGAGGAAGPIIARRERHAKARDSSRAGGGSAL